MKNKKFVIGFGILMVLFCLICLILVKRNDNNDLNNNQTNESIQVANLTNKQVLDKNETISCKNIDFTNIKNVKNYFSLNVVINNYYSSISFANSNMILNMLSSNYKDDNNININNVLSKIDSNYDSTFYIKSIVYGNYNNIAYYFVSGETFNYNANGDFISLINTKFLIRINNGNYSIEPLENNINLDKLINGDLCSDDEILENDDNEYNSINPTTYQIEQNYIRYYQDLLYNAPDKAYELLNNKTKNKYGSYDNFLANLDNIKTIFSKKIFGENVDKKDELTTYYLDMYENYKIVIYENEYMDFTIEFE